MNICLFKPGALWPKEADDNFCSDYIYGTATNPMQCQSKCLESKTPSMICISHFSMITRSDIVMGALSISSLALQVSGSSNFKKNNMRKIVVPYSRIMNDKCWWPPITYSRSKFQPITKPTNSPTAT